MQYRIGRSMKKIEDLLIFMGQGNLKISWKLMNHETFPIKSDNLCLLGSND